MLSTFNKKLTKTMSSPLVAGVLAVFLGIYGPRLSPQLPPVVRNLFNNNMFRFVVITLIMYLASKDLTIALIVAVAFCLIMSYSTSQSIEEEFINEIRENYSDFNTIREGFPKEIADEMNLKSQELETVEDQQTNSMDVEGEEEMEIGIEQEQDQIEDFMDDGDGDGQLVENFTDPTTSTTTSETETATATATTTTTKGQTVCADGLTSDKCEAYCYSADGFNDKFCQDNFPTPYYEKCGDNFAASRCLQSMCILDSNNAYCNKRNEETHTDISSALQTIEDKTASLVETYKNMS